ncbi:hypothetical protein D3C80_1731100 [compost metagenome]
MKAAVAYIKKHGFPEVVSFDHDLGMVAQPAGELWVAHEIEAPSGYDFAKWLAEQDMIEPWMLKNNFRFYVHSANPVGAENIRGFMSNYINYIKGQNA